jgi:hypothetical protein
MNLIIRPITKADLCGHNKIRCDAEVHETEESTTPRAEYIVIDTDEKLDPQFSEGFHAAHLCQACKEVFPTPSK